MKNEYQNAVVMENHDSSVSSGARLDAAVDTPVAGSNPAVLTATYETELPPDWVHPQRTAGIAAGRNHAGDEKVIDGVIEYSLGCALDESQPDDMREKSAEYAIGFAQGWHEIMMVQPMFLLTRQQTARVLSLPRAVRRAWKSEYDRGVRQWQRAGGTLSGRRPVLPEIP